MPTPFTVRDQDNPGRDLGEWTEDGSIRLPGSLTVTGAITSSGAVTGQDLTLNGDLQVNGVLGVEGTTFLGQLEVFGDLATQLASSGFYLAEGSNAPMGVATLVAGTVTVANTRVTANSRIFLTAQNTSGTPGFLRVSARVASTSFTILSSSGTDTTAVGYLIVEPTT
jgi:hypothetical protein